MVASTMKADSEEYSEGSTTPPPPSSVVLPAVVVDDDDDDGDEEEDVPSPPPPPPFLLLLFLLRFLFLSGSTAFTALSSPASPPRAPYSGCLFGWLSKVAPSGLGLRVANSRALASAFSMASTSAHDNFGAAAAAAAAEA
jgi:hypothetical protein